MRVLLVNQTYYPDKSATAQYLTDLAEFLAAKGNEVEVLTANAGYVEQQKFEPTETRNGVRISRIFSPRLGRSSMIRRILEALFLNLTFFFRLLLWRKVDQVVFLTSPPLIGVFVVLALRVRVSKVVFWVMDINPEQAARVGLLTTSSISYRVLDLFSRLVIRAVDNIVVLDRFMKAIIESKGSPRKKLTVIPLWAGEAQLRSIPRENNEFRSSHRWRDKFVVMLSGNFSICHPIDTLLEAAKTMAGEEEFVFAFVGDGARRREIEQFRDAHQLKNIELLPYQERLLLSESLSAADLHVISMGADYVGLVHPSKVYGVIAVLRPFLLLGPLESSVGDLVKRVDHGFQVDHGDVQGLCKVIRMIRDTRPRCQLLEELERDKLLDRLSREILD